MFTGFLIITDIRLPIKAILERMLKYQEMQKSFADEAMVNRTSYKPSTWPITGTPEDHFGY